MFSIKFLSLSFFFNRFQFYFIIFFKLLFNPPFIIYDKLSSNLAINTREGINCRTRYTLQTLIRPSHNVKYSLNGIYYTIRVLARLNG